MTEIVVVTSISVMKISIIVLPLVRYVVEIKPSSVRSADSIEETAVTVDEGTVLETSQVSVVVEACGTTLPS